MLGSLICSAYRALPRLASFGQISSSITNSPSITNQWSLTLSRTIMRYHFPRPNERRRIKRQGWHARMSTPGGRRILMRRILKGKYVLSH
ncbi:39S ribosomal protein L34, mitochondrial isoform X2 [Osmia bicornis bicornis]|uniref:39S ribosomal protein L34, mitochondrial isoform X2 n=1 Tax=Osmia bicornis bicornis TaxID=1437191 RepID=UPI0010F66ABA|nr:39S ribosomal protein L34, mitochondrial isoform X2 [Osmia bicornis bicornis]